MKSINHNPNASSKIVTLNKEMVDSLLACNANNRNLRQSVVERYCRDMKNGKWSLTHQGIAVSDDNVLIDGQHRLEAIKQLGYPPVSSVLVTGLKFDCQKNVDQQAKRSMRDVLKITFEAEFAKQAPAIARVVKRQGANSGFKSQMTPDEVIEVVEEYFNEIEFVCNSVPKDNFFAAAYLAGFCHCTKIYPEGWQAIKEFIAMTHDGEMLSKTMPAFHLRNYIVNSRGAGGGAEFQNERFKKTIKATECFLDGKEMKILRI